MSLRHNAACQSDQPQEEIWHMEVLRTYLIICFCFHAELQCLTPRALQVYCHLPVWHINAHTICLSWVATTPG